MIFLLLLYTQLGFGSEIGPTPFPVFLKEGFSTILEFEEAPSQIVLGDPNLFQVEKLNDSIVVKPLTAYASTNMFVYFKNKPTRLFLLNCTEENEPTFFKKFTSFLSKGQNSLMSDVEKSDPSDPAKPDTGRIEMKKSYPRQARLTKLNFDKDYLTIDLSISADSKSKILPSWDKVRLKYKSKYLTPSKLWSQRKEILKDSEVKARFIFVKANLPANLKDSSLVIPVKDSDSPFQISLERAK